ncbi:hypothetical protein IV203_019771 [Nitzschia inconspicua]|uniref:Uncharacterized protein n=1 Tax=Nitzschia inconspicua TaxID=303405 RepID=A0A9K3Q596_9STRA|nr:hypothetical protein IV203_019771 [Nitzschia inconspicua]
MSSIDLFFGDGDNRDSNREDFEEEAALLNESGGVSQPKDGLRCKKPAHAPKEQVTPWWCAMRNSFLKRCKKFQAAYGDDVVFGIEPVVPHYKNNSLSIGPVILGDPFAAVDQKSVLLEKRRREPAIQVPQNFQAIQKCLPDDFKISKDTVTEDWALTNCLELLQIGVTQSTEAKEAKEELKQLKHGMVKGDGLRLAAKLERRALDMLFVLKGADPTTEWRKKGKRPIVVLEDGSMHIKMS